MNQEKIGKFIAKCRKNKNMTQQQLAEKLGVSDRTIGNWENGRNMPDLSLFKPLCGELNISLNVEFKGNRSHKEIIPMLAKSKAMIINTIKDNSMLTIVESIACGTPIVTTDVPYNCYYIEKNNLGIVCKDNIKSNDLEKIIKENDKYVKNCIDYRYFVSNEYHIRQFISESKFLNN